MIINLRNHLQEYVLNVFKEPIKKKKKVFQLSVLFDLLSATFTVESALLHFSDNLIAVYLRQCLGFCGAFHCGISSSFASVLESRSVLFSFIK